MNIEHLITPPFLVPFVQTFVVLVVKNLIVTLRYSNIIKLHKEDTKNRKEEMSIELRLMIFDCNVNQYC
jgi:alpha-N-acetylglucosamine transferase